MLGLDTFFNPKSVAVIGASRTPGKLGYIILENLKMSFKGQIYPINPNASEILGLKVFPSILDVKEPVDQAIIVIPAEMVNKAVSECIRKKIRSCIIITSGFSEIGEKEREEKLRSLLKGGKIRIMGPNCLASNTPILITNDEHVKYKEMGNLIDYYLEKNPDKAFNVSGTTILPANNLDREIKVLSWNGRRFSFKKVLNFFKRHEKAVKVTLEGGKELVCSLDHPFLIKMPWGIEEIPTKDLEIGYKVPVVANIEINRISVKSIDLLEKADNLEESLESELRLKLDRVYKLQEFYKIEDKDYKNLRITTKHSRLSLPMHLPITHELCKLLGFFVADGHFHKNFLRIGFVESEDEEKEIRRCASEVFNSDNTNLSRTKGIKFGGKIGSLVFRHIFGIGRYAENKSVPDFIFSAEKDKIISFLSGLFSGDGCVYFNPKNNKRMIYLSSTSRTLINQTTYLLSILGISSNISVSKNRKAKFKNKIYNGKDLFYLRLESVKAIKKLYEMGFRFLDKKQNTDLENLVNSVKNEGGEEPNVVFKEIVEIENLEGEHDLYDFEIEDTHKFVANNIVTHNCIGIYKKDLDMVFFPRNRLKRPPEGHISFITQSGAFGSVLLDIISHEGVGVSKFISIGNKLDVNEIELMDYLGNDVETRCITMYLESIANGEEFVKVARRIVAKKPVVVFKAGKTEKGAEAVVSHTGALAGSSEIFSAAMRQAGVIEAKNSEEIFDFAKSLANQPVLKDNKIAIITEGGGFGVVATDAAVELGLELAKLEDSTLRKLKELLPSYASAKNPIDLTGDATDERYENTIDLVLKDKNISGAVIIALMQIPTLTDNFVNVLRDAKVHGKPITVCSAGGGYVLERNRKLESFGIPVYPTPERAVKGLWILHEYSKIWSKSVREKPLKVVKK